jgi:hypothetical protein
MMLMLVTFVGAFLLGRSTSSSHSAIGDFVGFVTGSSPENTIEENIKLFFKSSTACENSMTNINPAGNGEEFSMVRDNEQNIIYQKGSLYNNVKISAMKLHSFKVERAEKFGNGTVTLVLDRDSKLSERSFNISNIELEAAHGRLIHCSL